MNLLFDLDCLAKLHACSAFDDALSIFRNEEKRCFYVDTFPFSAKGFERKHSKANRIHLASIFHKIADRSLLSGFNELKTDKENMNILGPLTSIPNIDAGEAILLFYTFHMENALLLTGDKRFLTAVSENESAIREVIPTFDRKFIFFLNIVHRICRNNQAKISMFSTPEAFESDRELMSIFSGTPTLESITEATNSYTAKFIPLLFPI